MTQTIVKIVIISLIALFVLGLSGYILCRLTQKRWKCTESGCEHNITGKYKTEEDCNKNCKENNNSLVEDEDIEDEDIEDEDIENEDMAWACTSGYDCIPSREGNFVSKEACQELCIQPHPQYTQYYYPQSLIPWYLNRRPRYWSYRRFGRPIRHGDRNKRHHSLNKKGSK